jgi:hypothetical protein
MYSLDKKQVEIIAADVQLAGITFSHLPDDLVDHICCEVEILINEGKNFENAYKIVRKQVGIDVLQKIQENTKFLIDKNYRLMKTTMKISGNISLAMLGFGTIFKIMHLPGAGIILSFGFLVLCLMFLPMVLYANYKNETKKQNLFLHITALIGGITFMAGVLFKIMHWPGSALLLMVGYLSLLFLFLPTLLFVKLKSEQTKKLKNIYILGIVSMIIFACSNMFKMFHWPGAAVLMIFGSVMLIGLFLPLYTWQIFKMERKITGQYIYIVTISMFLILFTSLLSLNLSKTLVGGIVNQADNATLINNYLEKKNIKLLSEIENKKDTLELQSKAIIIKKYSDELCEYINNIQIDLVTRVDNIDKANAKKAISDPMFIIAKDNLEMVNLLMIGLNGNGRAQDLKQKLVQYKSNLSSNFKENIEFAEFLDNLINVSDKQNGRYTVSWEESNFNLCSLIRAISTLKELQSGVRMAEFKALENINILIFKK